MRDGLRALLEQEIDLDFARFGKLTAALMTKLIAIAALIFLIGSAGCSSPQAQSGPPELPPVPVTTAQAVEESVPIQIRTVGTAEAHSTVEVKSQVAGPLMNVSFAEGANVNQGDLLFEIDPRPFREALRQAEAA